MNVPRREPWLLDPGVTYLNHGSFGATPAAVLRHQHELQLRMEREPVLFMVRELEGLLDDARQSLAGFLGVQPADLAFVRNATAGVNAVLQSVHLSPGDELLTTNHEYNACRNVLEFVAGRAGARVVVASVPFPLRSEDEVVQALVDAVTSKTRLLLVDHITSQTGLVLPLERITNEMNRRGIDTLVDGAHAPGMIELDVDAAGATWYTGNCHKWICAPKGSAFLWSHPDRQREIRPVSISHGANSGRTDRSRYLIEFDWVGTDDPTAALTIPVALDFMSGLLTGGWIELRETNRALALEGRRILCDALKIEEPAPPSMIGSLATVPLPDGIQGGPVPALYGDPLQDALYFQHNIEVPVIAWPAPPRRLLRISAQIYNKREDYVQLADALMEELHRES
jgi:isopenicillin-N epimerase